MSDTSDPRHFPSAVSWIPRLTYYAASGTGLSVQEDDIIQIGATCRLYRHNYRNKLFDLIASPDLTEVDHDFCEYVKSDLGVSPEISKLTGITNRYLSERGTDLKTALERWLTWIHRLLSKCPAQTQVWFIAHNGNQFDLPLLFHQEMNLLRWHPGTFLKQVGATGIVDSLVLSRALFFAQQNVAGPVTRIVSQSHRLSDLYRTRFGSQMPNEHNALYDAKAIHCVMGEEPFSSAWCLYLVGWRATEYIRAFYRAFNKSQSRGSISPPELHVNRYLFDGVHLASEGSPLSRPLDSTPPWIVPRSTPALGGSVAGGDTASSTPLGAASEYKPPAVSCVENSHSRAFKYWQGFRTKIK